MNTYKQQLDSFITSVDAGGHKAPNSILDGVRKENVKVREVVNSFSQKVEVLVDKQRNEYMLAYENHMQDVQKELHSLREKVAEIANDETKADKTAKLKGDQIRFKNEALKLEADADEIRKKMKRLVRETYNVEKSRDWLLEKLREAKRVSFELQREKEWLVDSYDCGGSLAQASLSNASSYTLELQHPAKKKLAPLTFKVDRAQSIKPGQLVESSNSTGFTAFGNRKRSSLPLPRVNNTIEFKEKKEEVEALSKLISIRARRQELQKFLTLCSNSLHMGPWSRVNKRPMSSLIDACIEQVTSNKHFRHNPELLQLACELASQSDTYLIIMKLVNEKATISDSKKECENSDDGKVERFKLNASSQLQGISKCLRDIVDSTGNLDVGGELAEVNAEGQVPIDSDLLLYFIEQKESHKLRSMGIFQKDDFLNFK